MRDNVFRFALGPAGTSPVGGQPRAAAHTERPGWSYPPTRLLAPIDFGDASARALVVADTLARRHSAALSVLHADIIEAPAYFTHEQAAAIERDRQEAASAMTREMARFVRGVMLGPADLRFVEEAPAIAIAEAAARADLIVMGTHGRRGPSRWWLGSVAERTVRESPIPVLVVRAPVRSAAPAETLFKRPALVTGQAPAQGEAARYAQGLATAFGGAVLERALACEEDLVREREASLLVIARSAPGKPWVDTRAERLLRVCTLPLLFVPDQG